MLAQDLAYAGVSIEGEEKVLGAYRLVSRAFGELVGYCENLV